MMKARTLLKGFAAGLALAASTWAAAATDYPTQPVTIMVPFSTGGQFDTVGRLIGQFAAKKLGQSVIIENVSGGGGNIGAAKVARAKPDGYTLLTLGGNHTVSDALYANPGYNVLKDFSPISLVTVSPHVVLVNSNFPVKTFDELVKYSKAHPNSVTYGTPGIGTSMHLTFEMIKKHYGLSALHVPYRGGSKMLMDLEGGQVNVGIVAVAPALQALKTGRVRALVVTSKEGSPAVPDVPALAESSYPPLHAGSWVGIVGPKGMPEAAVSRWNEVLKEMVNDPTMKQKLESLGFRVEHTTPEQFAKFIKSEHDTYGEVVKSNHISAQ